MTNGIHVWLDDERDPADPKYFKRGSSPEMVWVKTVEQAIKLLETGNVLSISLDNDLGLGNLEGYHVADWIEQAAHEGRLKKLMLFAHTDNPVRKRYMKLAFYSAKKAWLGK